MMLSVIASVLTQNTEEGVRQVYQRLVSAKEAAALDLQRNVYKNYSEFVVISKEISKLESEMLFLQAQLNELKDVNEDILPREESPIEGDYEEENAPALSPTTPASVTDNSPTDISYDSVASAKRKQMEAFYEMAEGLQKCLPDDQVRTIIRNGAESRFWEINTSNEKQKQAVQIHVLSDAMVVTVKKKSMISGRSRLVVDKCWKLSEIAVIDVKDTGKYLTSIYSTLLLTNLNQEYSNGFKVMKHPDTVLYRSETFEEKRVTLSSIKRIVEALAEQKRKEKAIEIAHLADTPVKSLPDYRSGSAIQAVEGTRQSDFAEIMGANSLKDDLTPADVKWLTELPDELDVLIAHREFDRSVSYIEKARKTLNSKIADTPRVITMKASVEERVAVLSALVSRDLVNPIITKRQVQIHISRLMKLGLGEQARNLFLSTRSATMRHRIRQLKFDGEVVSYINKLSEIVFRTIRNTCFVRWVKNEIENYATIFRMQVFDGRQNFMAIENCVQATLRHGRQLRDVGLDMTFVLDLLFFEDLAKAVEIHARRYYSLPVSSSVNKFHSVLLSFGADVSLVMSIALYKRIIICLTSFFDTFMDQINHLYKKSWTHVQRTVIISDVRTTIMEIIPKISQQLEQVVQTILTSQVYDTEQNSCWVTPAKVPRQFGFGGVQQLVLDVQFFLALAESIISEETNHLANDVCERALRLYFQQNVGLQEALKVIGHVNVASSLISFSQENGMIKELMK
ncbi:hypothetical protein BJ742DRAFT_872731 [Cladochytrium replicatum]|nr:hypothetical protein BJ742DRAFT_872731 [Cladochytrium replicatum]